MIIDKIIKIKEVIEKHELSFDDFLVLSYVSSAGHCCFFNNMQALLSHVQPSREILLKVAFSLQKRDLIEVKIGRNHLMMATDAGRKVITDIETVIY